MSVLTTRISHVKSTTHFNSTNKFCSNNAMEHPPANFQTSSNQIQSARVRRRSLNISHYNAIHNAISNLARIDDFDLEEIGSGFFSDVFKVIHKQTGKVMVLKRNKDTNTKMNILREVQLMNRLSHPNILKFKGVCVHEGQLHALLEYVNGGDLDQLITAKKVVLTWKQRMQLALDLANGVQYLHSVGLFHRDLSAKNCLIRVTDIGQEKYYTGIVSDLGLAEKIPTTMEEKQQLSIVGTPYIMAPEMLNQKPYDEKVDVFSFGLLLCQLIALVSNDPSELPRSKDFGLARDLFQKLISNSNPPSSNSSSFLSPPHDFLTLAYDSCQLLPSLRPAFSEIVSRLDKQIASIKQKRVGRPSSLRNETVPNNLKGNSFVSVRSSDETKSDQLSPCSQQRSRSSSSSSARLSRSHSDFSSELLIQVADKITSTDNDIQYTNPFSTLEHLNNGRMKLMDEPSMALLEMTFDLTTLDNLKAFWNESHDRFRYKNISKSVILVDGPSNAEHCPPKSRFLPSNTAGCGENNVFESPRTSSSDESFKHPECFRRAQHRAMILSPLGNKFATKWCSRHLSCHGKLQSRRQSFATIVSLLSDRIGDLPRSISLPDLSRITGLFTSSLSSEDGTKSYGRLSSKHERSSTYNVGSRHSSKEPIFEESETDLMQLDSRCSSFVAQEFVPEKSSLKVAVIPKDFNENFCLLNPLDGDMLDSQQKASDLCRSEAGDIPTVIAASTTVSFSSSSSSGCSSNSITVSLQSGEVTQQRRFKKEVLKSNLQNSFCATNTFRGDLPHPRLLSTKSNNRDSGFEDAISDAAISPNSDSQHHLSWKIPEESYALGSMHD